MLAGGFEGCQVTMVTMVAEGVERWRVKNSGGIEDIN